MGAVFDLAEFKANARREKMLHSLNALRAEVEAGTITGFVILAEDVYRTRRLAKTGTFTTARDALVTALWDAIQHV